MTARHTRPWCSTCRRSPADMPRHLSTASHRAAIRRAIMPTSPRGRVAYTPRRDGARVALRALANWDRQYDDEDPGNSPEWDAEYAEGSRS